MRRRSAVLILGLALAAPAAAGPRLTPGGPTAGAGAGSAAVAGRNPARTTKVAGQHCPEAGRAIVSVPVGFDGVRVVVADTLPGAAVDVTVMAGAADRRVRAWGGGAWSLHMDEAPSGPVLVAVEPSLDTPAGACVERVELLRDQRVVADVRLR